jgi:hypothetical protein
LSRGKFAASITSRTSGLIPATQCRQRREAVPGEERLLSPHAKRSLSRAQRLRLGEGPLTPRNSHRATNILNPAVWQGRMCRSTTYDYRTKSTPQPYLRSNEVNTIKRYKSDITKGS